MSLPRRAFLGAELPPDEAAFTEAGLRIAGVRAGGMAERAGLAPRDELVRIADHPVRDLGELAAALRRAGTDAETTLRFVRDGETRTRVIATVPAPPPPGVDLGELAVDGARLRTLLRVPESCRGIVVYLQGIACESVEAGPAAELADAWAAAELASLRFDKRGVGDSEGAPCRDTDFITELADARAAVTYARASGLPVFVFGHSVGGILAAQLAAGTHGVLVYGTPVMPWIDCLVDSTQRQLAMRGATDEELAAQLADIHALAARGELNGRSAAYHRQLAALDLAAAWQAVDVPILVARGEHDWVVRADDQARIAELARGPVDVVDLPGLDHLMGWHPDRDASLQAYGAGASDAALAGATVEWIEAQLAR